MQRVSAEELHHIATEIVLAFGAPESLATQVAASLVESDLRGHGSHGVIRLATTYQPMIDAEGSIRRRRRRSTADQT